jgi:serine/threonine protein kinase
MTLKEYAGIEELSNILSDPIQMSNLLLRVKFDTANKRMTFNESLSELEKTSKTVVRDSQAVYFVLRHEEKNRVIRGILVGDYVVALIIEEAGVIKLKGKDAFSELITSYRASNPAIKVSYARIKPEVAEGTPIEGRLKEIISRVAEEKPPNIWVGRIIYDFKVTEALSDKGGFTYVLRAVGKDGLSYVLKIPRDKLPNGTPLALSGPEKISEFMRSYINSIEVCHPDRFEVSSFILKNGLSENLYWELAYYRKYVLCPRGFIIAYDGYDADLYLENPPVVIEPYAELGDLQDYVSRKKPDAKFIVSIGLRVSGALGLAHAMSILHLDVKPQNILLAGDKGEPYGVRPYIGDFASTSRVLEGWARPTRVTPEFADPLSLIEGKAGFDYDVYSLGLTLLSSLTQVRLSHRTLVNLLALKHIHKMNISIEPFLLDHPALATFFRDVEPVFKGFAEGRVRLEELEERTVSLIVERDKMVLDVLGREVDKDLLAFLLKASSLRRGERFRNAVEFWLSLKKLAAEKKWGDVIPTPTS